MKNIWTSWFKIRCSRIRSCFLRFWRLSMNSKERNQALASCFVNRWFHLCEKNVVRIWNSFFSLLSIPVAQRKQFWWEIILWIFCFQFYEELLWIELWGHLPSSRPVLRSRRQVKSAKFLVGQKFFLEIRKKSSKISEIRNKEPKFL